MTAVGDEVAAPLEEARQQQPVLGWVVDVEGALFPARPAGGDGVVVVENPPLAGQADERLVGHRRPPADVADVDDAFRPLGQRRKAKDIRRQGKVGAGPPDDPGHLLGGVAEAHEDVVELAQQLQQVARQLVRPELVDEAGGDAAALAPARHRGQGKQLVGVVEDGKEERVVPLQRHR
jgi:hypothetical protein